jgi:hypothetical protein
MLRKFICVGFHSSRVEGTVIMRNYHENPSARGAYMLRKSFVLVFVRLRARARHHEGLL